MTRPAEIAGAAGSVAILVAHVAGVTDPATITYIAAGVGLVPGAVTFLVTNGGLRGVASKLWAGDKSLVRPPREPRG